MLSTYRLLLSRYRRYIIAALMLFTVGIALGIVAAIYYPEQVQQLFQMVVEQLERLGQDIFTGSKLQGTITLFLHNLRAVGLIAALGLALGIYPAFAMVLNGAIIGLVGVVTAHQSSWLTFISGIIPHGILEIPALIIGAAIGLRLGIGPLFAKPRSPFARYDERDSGWRGYRQELKNALVLLGLTVVLLALAAIIEVNITPLILAQFRQYSANAFSPIAY